MKPNIKLYLFILSFVLTLFYINDNNNEYQDFMFGALVILWSLLAGLVCVGLYKKMNTSYGAKKSK